MGPPSHQGDYDVRWMSQKYAFFYLAPIQLHNVVLCSMTVEYGLI